MTELQKLGMSLAVAYNDDVSSLDDFTRHAEDIDEIYLPVPCDVAGTMRIWYGAAPRHTGEPCPGLPRA